MKFSILSVDPNLSSRLCVAMALEPEGCKVTHANNGVEAIALLNERPFDLVITAIIMPEMDGVTFISELNKIAPQMPVIVLTAIYNIELKDKVIQMGARAYLLKPFAKEKLKCSVGSALEIVLN